MAMDIIDYLKMLDKKGKKNLLEWFECQSEESGNELLESVKKFEEARKFWIAGAIKKKGALRAQLGIKEGETIPKSILQRIVSAETGTKINFKGKTIVVTTKLKRRAILALKLGKMPKRGK